jgi:hypothetical protein
MDDCRHEDIGAELFGRNFRQLAVIRDKREPSTVRPGLYRIDSCIQLTVFLARD